MEMETDIPFGVLLREASKFLDLHPVHRNPWSRSAWSADTKGRVLNLVKDTLEEAYETAQISYPSNSNPANVEFVQGYGLRRVPDPTMACLRRDVYLDRFDKFVFVLVTIVDALEKGRRVNKRDVYYQHVNNFSSQDELDAIINRVVSIFGIPRIQLGLVATSKGLVAGNLRFTEDTVSVDCSLVEGGVPVPQDVASLTGVLTGAKMILVVEKDTVYQRITQDLFKTSTFDDLIILTGKGVPDLATRRLLFELSSRLRLPVLILTDCDPFGMEIMLTYRFGSRSMAICGEILAVPSAHWLGIRPTDLNKFQFGANTQLPLSLADSKKLKDISKRPYLKSMEGLGLEIETLKIIERKVEIEQIAELPGFNITQFILKKIKALDVI